MCKYVPIKRIDCIMYPNSIKFINLLILYIKYQKSGCIRFNNSHPARQMCGDFPCVSDTDYTFTRLCAQSSVRLLPFL